MPGAEDIPAYSSHVTLAGDTSKVHKIADGPGGHLINPEIA